MPIPWELLTWSSKPGSRKKTFCRGSGDDLRSCIPTDLANLGHWKEKGSTSLPLLSDQSIWIQFYHRDLAWSSNQPGLLVQFFFLQSIIHVSFQYDHISTSPFHWGSPLLRPHSARDVVGSKQPPSQGYLAHSKCLCKESTVLIVFRCVYLLFAFICQVQISFTSFIMWYTNEKLYKWYIRIDIIKKFHDFWNHLSTR